jgi:hypothetical protein
LAAQIGMPDYGETQKIVNQTLKLMMKPSAGNDEVILTIK